MGRLMPIATSGSTHGQPATCGRTVLNEKARLGADLGTVLWASFLRRASTVADKKLPDGPSGQ